jgi:hypothetical protein
MNAADLLAGQRVVPVVVIDSAEDAVPLAKTLLENGLDAIEVTLRTDAGLGAIERIASEVPGMLVGAGSVRRALQVAAVKSAGATFADRIGDARLAGSRLYVAEILPGRTVRGRRVPQGDRRTDPGSDVHAHRRHRPG